MDKQNRLKLFGTFTNSKKLYDKIVNEETLTAEEKSKVKRSNYQYSRAMKDEYDAIVGDGSEDTSSDSGDTSTEPDNPSTGNGNGNGNGNGKPNKPKTVSNETANESPIELNVE